MIAVLTFFIIVFMAIFAYELYNALSVVNDGRLVWNRPEDIDAVRTSLYTMAFSFVMTVMTWIILCIALQR
jgi:hypothetical protein